MMQIAFVFVVLSVDRSPEAQEGRLRFIRECQRIGWIADVSHKNGQAMVRVRPIFAGLGYCQQEAVCSAVHKYIFSGLEREPPVTLLVNGRGELIGRYTPEGGLRIHR
jgi:hypothetical protein